MLEKIKVMGAAIFGGAIFVAIAALTVVFIKGSLWASEHLLRPLLTVGWLALALVIIVLLPLSLFRRLRGFTGSAIFLSSILFGAIAWLLGFILAYDLWGLWAVIISPFLLGGGVVPVALLATMFKGMWNPFLMLLVLSAFTFGSRIIGASIARSS